MYYDPVFSFFCPFFRRDLNLWLALSWDMSLYILW